MKQLVLTIIGKDKAGLVEQLSRVINEHRGNWMASNLSHLAGYFSRNFPNLVPCPELA